MSPNISRRLAPLPCVLWLVSGCGSSEPLPPVTGADALAEDAGSEGPADLSSLDLAQVDFSAPPEDGGAGATDVATPEDVAPPPSCGDDIKPYFCPCENNLQCASLYCVDVDEPDVARRCSEQCTTTCDNGWECRGAGGADPVFLCLPPLVTLCEPCVENADCQVLGAQCVSFRDGDFCGRDCMSDPTCPAGYTCGDITNEIGQTTGRQCLPTSGSCQCPVGVDYQTDPDNCGFCTNRCAYFGAVPGCAGGACFMASCSPGFVDLDASDANGCEYACTFASEDDWPDAACDGSGCDQNCDGIDGAWSRAVFVASNGRAGASGTVRDPAPTITAGIEAARRAGKDHVYIAAGTYNEEVTLADGVSIFGGYSNDGLWARDLARYKTTVQNGSGATSVRVLVADGAFAKRTVVDGLEVIAGTNPNQGESSYAIWVRGASNKLELTRLTALGGNGGAGRDGVNGARGPDGVVGQPGESSYKSDTYDCSDSGCNEFEDLGGTGATGGPNQCTGGRSAAGARGGNSGCGNGGGAAGQTSDGGAPGGASSGSAGVNGGAGAAGAHGDGGVGFAVTGGFWRGAAGKDGVGGQHGVGGGGGAGGRGKTDCWGLFDCWGGGGGGGGSGGCGGTFGRFGSAGGGSFGLFLVDASPKLTDCTFGHKNGGNGGRGGDGGGGGLGRAGGDGGRPCSSAGTGGKGGSGGAGGAGGAGGGGAGGAAFGLFLHGTSNPACSGLRYGISQGTGGTGGAGGAGGNRGTAGASGDRFGASALCP